jgi:hypothetical protein
MLAMSANAKTHTIRLKEVIERGDDWLRCGFDAASSTEPPQ